VVLGETGRFSLKTGVYWLRKRVPARLIKVVGKRPRTMCLRSK
jgi:hypothetical protein